jgi:alkyl sulfatase BDS1-like metallo-beta-lactamase superfamily hydrolase
VLAVTKDTIPQKSESDMSLSLDLETYKSLVNGSQKVVDVVKTGKANFEGNINDLEMFIAIFDPLFVYEKEHWPSSQR